MGLRRLARVGGGRDVVSLTPTQTVPPAPIPVPPRGMGPGTSVGRALGAAGPYWEDWGGEGGGHQRGRATPWGPLMGGQCCRAGGFRRAPRSRGHRWCQLSPGSCGWPARGHGDIPAAPRVPAVPAIWAPPHPPQDPHAYSPPPRRIAGAAAANSSPRPHLGNIWVGGGCPLPWGLSGGRMLPGGGRGVPKAPGAGGMNEVVAWATAPEPGGLPRAAGSCAGSMGGGVGSGSPPGCAHPKRTRATCGPWSTVAGAMAPPLSASGGHGNGQGVVAVTLRWLGPAGLVCAPPHMGGPGVLPGWWPASCWAGSRGRRDLTGMVAATLLGCCP